LFHGRMARLVVPGCAHHVTQRGNRRMEIFFGAGLPGLSRAAGQGLGAERRRLLGLLSDADPCASDPGAAARPPAGDGRAARGPGARGQLARLPRRGPSPLHPPDRFSRGLAGAPLAGALPLLRHGRGASPDLRALCGAEPGDGRPSGPGRGLALVERAGSSGRPGRFRLPGGASLGAGREVAGPRLADAARGRDQRGGAGKLPRPWPHGPARSARWISWHAWKASPAATSSPAAPVDQGSGRSRKSDADA
jgi:hypothetical protein